MQPLTKKKKEKKRKEKRNKKTRAFPPERNYLLIHHQLHIYPEKRFYNDHSQIVRGYVIELLKPLLFVLWSEGFSLQEWVFFFSNFDQMWA